ncbi:AAA family ATPase [Baaleninema simplex]|uniref:AAA family ATPase n=1 Tax=Baaleninema simplex TaxID=2862350 RepID=UPI00034DF1A1|nr:AAA family ATPase [Baaleninema simplex]
MQGIIFTGIQGSGKSTFYFQNFANTHIRINLDMLKTRHREKLIFEACLEAKQPLVIDNTNPTKADRARYIPRLKAYKFSVIGYFFESSLPDCLHRNNQRSGKAKIPEIGVRSTHKKLEIPDYSEGFDRLFSVTIQDGIFKISEIPKNPKFNDSSSH